MEQKITEFLNRNADWQHIDNQLVGVWELSGFTAVTKAVTAICDLAAQQDHHPTVTFGYNTLQVATTTHDTGNVVTNKDLELALTITKHLEMIK